MEVVREPLGLLPQRLRVEVPVRVGVPVRPQQGTVPRTVPVRPQAHHALAREPPGGLGPQGGAVARLGGPGGEERRGLARPRCHRSGLVLHGPGQHPGVALGVHHHDLLGAQLTAGSPEHVALRSPAPAGGIHQLRAGQPPQQVFQHVVVHPHVQGLHAVHHLGAGLVLLAVDLHVAGQLRELARVREGGQLPRLLVREPQAHEVHPFPHGDLGERGPAQPRPLLDEHGAAHGFPREHPVEVLRTAREQPRPHPVADAEHGQVLDAAHLAGLAGGVQDVALPLGEQVLLRGQRVGVPHAPVAHARHAVSCPREQHGELAQRPVGLHVLPTHGRGDHHQPPRASVLGCVQPREGGALSHACPHPRAPHPCGCGGSAVHLWCSCLDDGHGLLPRSLPCDALFTRPCAPRAGR